MPNLDIQILGIRHHGPGSARSLVRALDEMRPTVVLIEGPPDADSILPMAADAGMEPPVALLIYVPDEPRRCIYDPFAVFSPEWRAIQWALGNDVPVRFMDLPQGIQFAMASAEEARSKSEDEDEDEADGQEVDDLPELPVPSEDSAATGSDIRRDPLRALAEAAGYTDGERWWDQMVEHRTGSADIFTGILEAMTALRSEADQDSPIIEGGGAAFDTRNLLREAYMRQTIRAAVREGHERIAVVCGAWHAPALHNLGPAKADKALLDGLPKLKTAACWIPWTYSRLSYQTGYGAGIESPGWYHHLWTYGQSPSSTTASSVNETADVSSFSGRFLDTPLPARDERSGRGTEGEGRADDWGLGGRVVIPWLTKVAHLLREHDLDASPGSIIEAVRLADCLATLRGRSIPGLPELNEATQTVLCFGGSVPMQLIAEKLIIGERLGDVPENAPAVPLQQDLQRQQKRLRIAAEASQKVVDYDLRKPGDLERSELLHRLNLLGLPWGRPERGGAAKGTFHELWRLQWHPEFYITLIEKGIWGNTVLDASAAFAEDRAEKAADLPTLTRLLEAVMLARLPVALRRLMERIEEVSARASDVQHLMAALPPLANVLRYGDVRGTDTSMAGHTIDGLVARICIGLPGACASLDDDATEAMSARIASTNGAIALLQNEDHLSDWRQTLQRLVERPNLCQLPSGGGTGVGTGRIGGQCTRLLLDAGVYTADEAGRQMSLALSAAVDPARAAAWVEGFLAGSGLLLVHDRALWQILDDWVTGLGEDHFTALLPLLCRTFATYSAPERRQLGERAASGRTAATDVDDTDDLDHARAAESLPYVMQLLGLT